MARFTVRVELHRAVERDYILLHEEMERRGFERTITSHSGRTYHLPTAEYSYDGNTTKESVRELARSAAGATGKQSAVLVTESAGRTWAGLDEV